MPISPNGHIAVGAGAAARSDGGRGQRCGRVADRAPAVVAPLFEIFHRAGRGIHAGDGAAGNDPRVGRVGAGAGSESLLRSVCGASSAFATDTTWFCFYVLAGYFLVHFFEHTMAPHFHFGEETHHEEISHSHASYAALLGLVIHTFLTAWRSLRACWYLRGLAA